MSRVGAMTRVGARTVLVIRHARTHARATAAHGDEEVVATDGLALARARVRLDGEVGVAAHRRVLDAVAAHDAAACLPQTRARARVSRRDDARTLCTGELPYGWRAQE